VCCRQSQHTTAGRRESLNNHDNHTTTTLHITCIALLLLDLLRLPLQQEVVHHQCRTTAPVACAASFLLPILRCHPMRPLHHHTCTTTAKEAHRLACCNHRTTLHPVLIMLRGAICLHNITMTTMFQPAQATSPGNSTRRTCNTTTCSRKGTPSHIRRRPRLVIVDSFLSRLARSTPEYPRRTA